MIKLCRLILNKFTSKRNLTFISPLFWRYYRNLYSSNMADITVKISKNDELLKQINYGKQFNLENFKEYISIVQDIQKQTNEYLTELVNKDIADGKGDNNVDLNEEEEDDDDDDEDKNHKGVKRKYDDSINGTSIK